MTTMPVDQTGLTIPLRILRRALPVAMLIILLAAAASVVRLGLSLGEPFPGFAMMWRKELKSFTVGHLTPLGYPGLRAGMQINDRILCIDGYHPHPEAVVYGSDIQPEDTDCTKSLSFSDLYRRRYQSSEQPAVDILVDRNGRSELIEQVPLVLFSRGMLAEALFPPLLVGLALVGLAAVVYRANSTVEPNLLFATAVLILAAFFVDHGFTIIISDKWAFAPRMAMLLVVPWMPLVGAVLVHLMSVFPEQRGEPDRINRWAKRIRKPFYAVSIFFASIGVFNFAFDGHPVTLALDFPYLIFITVSVTFALVWACLRVFLLSRRSLSIKTRRQARLLLFGLGLLTLSVVPYALFFFTERTSELDLISIAPYLTLGFVAVIAYAILRYQLFSSRIQVLTGLLILFFSVLVANVVYLLLGSRTGFLPLFLAALMASWGLASRIGPTSFFNRLLRREMLDYERVVDFNHRVVEAQDVKTLMQVATDSLSRLLETENIWVWLVNEERHTLEVYENGQKTNRMLLPAGFVDRLSNQPAPLYAETTAASPFDLSAPAGAVDDVAVWVPLVERGQAVGMMGLGPRWTGELYDEQDIQLVGILAQQLTLSVLNSHYIKHLQASSRLIRSAEEKERLKIARELHDTILQFLLVLTYGLDDLKLLQADASREIEHWQDRISDEAESLRGLLAYLRAPETLVEQGLVPALGTWLEQAQSETPAQITWTLSPQAEAALTTEAQLAIYRVAREAVHNAIKHARADSIQVSLQSVRDRVLLLVEDDGRGFDLGRALAEGGKGKGYSSLQDMHLYLESVGGRLEIETEAGKGTGIRGELPKSGDA